MRTVALTLDRIDCTVADMDDWYLHRHRRQPVADEPDAQRGVPLADRNLLDWTLGPQGLEPHIAKEPVIHRATQKIMNE